MITVFTTGAIFTYTEGSITKPTMPGFIGVFKAAPNRNLASPELLGEHKTKTVVSILHKEAEEI